MNLLQAIFRGAADRQRYENFMRRYESGHPADGYSDGEVLRAYHEVSELLSPSLYCSLMVAALERLTPEERRAFATAFLRRCRPYLKFFIDPWRQPREHRAPEDAQEIARLATDLQRRRPGALGRVLAEEHARAIEMDRPTRGVLAGITAYGIRHFLAE